MLMIPEMQPVLMQIGAHAVQIVRIAYVFMAEIEVVFPQYHDIPVMGYIYRG